MNITADLSIDEVFTAAQADDYIGFCIHCGAEEYGVEPDARDYDRGCCPESSVYGAMEILFHIA